MLAAGGLKAAAKRTAFGDVSNTAKSLNTIHHDESAINGKSVEVIKPIAIQDKSAALLRPAQRPLNNGPRAPLATSTSEQASIAPLPKQTLPNQTKRNTLAKKGAVYKDTGIENIHPLAQKPVVSTNSVTQTHGPRHAKSQPDIKAEQPVLRRTQSKHLNNVIDNVEPTVYHNASEQPLKENVNDSHLQSIKEKDESIVVVEKLKSQKQLPVPPIPSEPEEYWPEDEEEAYDEQGYTIAHSFRGENTTGGATTVIVPKVTNKVKKELADAKILVESVRTQEDIEDEMWDTSMVAEYGEEIFSYMRELEVSCSTLH